VASLLAQQVKIELGPNLFRIAQTKPQTASDGSNDGDEGMTITEVLSDYGGEGLYRIKRQRRSSDDGSR
jgi:hypothetical protein